MEFNEKIVKDVIDGVAQAENIEVTGFRIALKCKCGHTWGVNVLRGILPFRWTYCISCLNERGKAVERILKGGE
jgi:hypothetical protein